MEPLAVDVREAGRLTSLSPHTIRKMYKDGRLQAVRVSRRVLIPVAELKRLLREDMASSSGNHMQEAGEESDNDHERQG